MFNDLLKNTVKPGLLSHHFNFDVIKIYKLFLADRDFLCINI